jgi:hypothetical protein
MKQLIGLLLLSIPIFSFANVTITINETQYHYSDNPRLTEVLEPIAGENWYWPAATLFRLNDKKIEKSREQAISALASLTDNSLLFDDYRPAANYLISQIKAWNLATRVNITIYYDLARIKPEFNPQFEDGEYLLSIKPPKIPIYEFGMTEKTGFFTAVTGMCADQYLTGKQLKPLADKDYLYVVQPNGEITKVGKAYWNYQCRTLMPGAQLFVPISEKDVFSQVSKVNKLVAELSLNRIMR